MSLTSAVAICRLITHGGEIRVVLPIVVAILVADTLTAAAARRLGVVAAFVIGLVGSLVALLISVDPTFLNPGSSHFFHFAVLSQQLHAADYALANDGTPLPLLNGVVVALGALGAATAALARVTWMRRERSLRGSPARAWSLGPCIAPSFAVFLYSSLVSAEHGRQIAALAYFAGVLIFVASSDRGSPVGVAGVGPGRVRRQPRTIGLSMMSAGTVVMFAACLAVVVAAGFGLSGMRLTVFHVTPPPAPSGGSTLGKTGAPENLITGLALVDNLLTTEVQQSNIVIFRALSPVTTYWQVGTVSTFNGTQWVPTPGVDAALSGSSGASAASLAPSVLPEPTSLPTYNSLVAISDFASRLLPAPPHAVSVTGLAGAVAVDEEGVLAATTSGPGTDYEVSARLDTAISNTGPQLSASDPRLAPYLALPSQPAVVNQLARQATAGATTNATKAQKLLDFFRSGRFRYTPPPPPTSGADPLVQFLTVTKAGFCQQFAGAYGVLARSLGIPTRLVVGFTAGAPGDGGTFTVTGADAHVWPQVYLGPATGWISVEPTPPVGAGAPTPAGFLEPSGSNLGSSTPTNTTVPNGAPAPTPTTQPATHAGTSHHGVSAPSHGGIAWWMILLIVAAVVALAGLALRLFRRRRAVASEHDLNADQRIVRAWERAHHALRTTGLPPRRGETAAEYAARVLATEPGLPQPVNAESLAELAALVELACYTPSPCTADQAEDAEALAAGIVAATRIRPAAASREPVRA